MDKNNNLESTALYSQFQKRWIAIAPKFTAALSMLGSGLIVYKVLRSPENMSKIYNRILLWMSLYEIVQSFTLFLGTWPIPDGEPTFGASGNMATCRAQGFFLMIGHAVPLYNCFLAAHYVLKVRYNFTETRLQKFEWPVHCGIFVFVTSGGIAALVTNSFNPAGAWCWLSAAPSGCTKIEAVECTRGQHATLLRSIFTFVSVVGSIIVVTIAMIMLYRSVKGIEKKASQYAGSQLLREQHRYQKSKAVAQQAVFYVASLYAAYLPSLIIAAMMITGERTGTIGTIICIAVFMYPSQGFFNFLVYMRSNSWNFDDLGLSMPSLLMRSYSILSSLRSRLRSKLKQTTRRSATQNIAPRQCSFSKKVEDGDRSNDVLQESLEHGSGSHKQHELVNNSVIFGSNRKKQVSTDRNNSIKRLSFIDALAYACDEVRLAAKDSSGEDIVQASTSGASATSHLELENDSFRKEITQDEESKQHEQVKYSS